MIGTPRAEQRRQAAVLSTTSKLTSFNKNQHCSNPEWEPISVGGALYCHSRVDPQVAGAGRPLRATTIGISSRIQTLICVLS